MKKITTLTLLSLIVSLFASISAMAASEVVIERTGGTVTLTNVTKQQNYLEGGEIPRTLYIVSGSSTLSINGEDPHFYGINYHPNGKLANDDFEWGENSEYIDFEWEYSEYIQRTGNSITLNKNGYYSLVGWFTSEYSGDTAAEFVVQVTGGTASATKPQAGQDTNSPALSDNPVSAKPTTSKVTVNGKEVAFDAYTINNNNYFKLRDIAYVVNGTDKQFEVSWDSENNIIRLNSGKEYVAVGGELKVSSEASSKNAKSTSSMIIVDGEAVEITAYNIGGNNYFKLRDIAKVFNIGVTWDNATRTVGIDTEIDYKE